MNEPDREVDCPKCLADAGQPCFIGDGPSDIVHLSRRVKRLCRDQKKTEAETVELISRTLALEEA